MNEPVNFIVKFGISRKLVTVSELHEIFDLVAIAFKCQRFMHKDMNELIDLDSPIHLNDRANNELLIISEYTVTTSEPSVMKMNLIRQIIPCMFLCIYLVFILTLLP